MESSASNATAYGYDARNRLSSAGGAPHTIDKADEITQQPFPSPTQNTTFTYDAANQLTMGAVSAGPAYTYSFDNAGNRHSRVDGSGNTLTYNYDQLNRLTGYVPSGPTPPTYGYTYNGDGLRMAKSTSGSSTAGFTWDVAEGLPLLLSDGSTSYVSGPGGLPIEQVTASGALYFYQADQLGSTRLITNASGASVDTYTYDAYGNLTASTGSLANPFQFAGQFTDSETGFYYLRARYYDPATGAFTARDSLTAVTRQPYVYVRDSPLNATDPTGMWCAGWHGGAMGFLGGNGLSGGFSSSSGVGYCDNGDFFAEGTVGAFGETFCFPSCNGTAKGSFYSCGVGVFASPNAHQAQDLAKGFRTSTNGAGVGVGGDFTSSSGTGVSGQPVDVYSAGPLGASFGVGTADYDTYTNVGSWNWVQHLVNDPLVNAAKSVPSWL